ncbi:AbrB/MazE/SpoVT family DNA-binding domain-containing protein [Jiella sp. M17.18]|uniref:AbrB/MazE/SpoVT family DNA-binding domain-containing protein n=1 Tax=Jiella sp. M17.18 TaxID=3234247 RepID=UPI0034DE0AB9
MLTSKLNAGLTTIPAEVLEHLGLREGDEIVYVITGDEVRMARRQPETRDDPFAIFYEWNSEEDEKGYERL